MMVRRSPGSPGRKLCHRKAFRGADPKVQSGNRCRALSIIFSLASSPVSATPHDATRQLLFLCRIRHRQRQHLAQGPAVLLRNCASQNDFHNEQLIVGGYEDKEVNETVD